MGNVTVNTVFYYSTHRNSEKLERSKIYELTLDLDKKFISAIQPHIPACVKNVKELKICQAYACKVSDDSAIGNDVDLYKSIDSNLNVEQVLTRIGLLKGIKLGAEDIIIYSTLLLAVSFEFPEDFPD